MYAAGCVLFEMLALEDTSCLLRDKLLGGVSQLQAQLALCPLEQPWEPRMLELAGAMRIDLNRCARKALDGLPAENALKHWTNLQSNLARKFHRSDLIPIATDLIRSLLCFNPGRRATVKDVFSHQLLPATGADLEIITRVHGEFLSPNETFADDIEPLPTHEVRAREVKRRLWHFVKCTRQSQLPASLERAYPGERLTPTELGEEPVTEAEPISKRTRSQLHKQNVLLVYVGLC
jgi:serine/threonine protein kinase